MMLETTLLEVSNGKGGIRTNSRRPGNGPCGLMKNPMGLQCMPSTNEKTLREKVKFRSASQLILVVFSSFKTLSGSGILPPHRFTLSLVLTSARTLGLVIKLEQRGTNVHIGRG